MNQDDIKNINKGRYFYILHSDEQLEETIESLPKGKTCKERGVEFFEISVGGHYTNPSNVAGRFFRGELGKGKLSKAIGRFCGIVFMKNDPNAKKEYT